MNRYRRTLKPATLSRPLRAAPEADPGPTVAALSPWRHPVSRLGHEREPTEALKIDGWLDRARSQWLLGDWEGLRSVDGDALRRHPDRAKLSLLVAAAHQNLGDDRAATAFARSAIEWGCDRQLVARVLLAGVHDTLAVAAAAQGDTASSDGHFRESSSIVGNWPSTAENGAKAVRELARSGLLQEAARVLGLDIDSARQTREAPAALDARITILQSELELLRDELATAQMRGQLRGHSESVASTQPAAGLPLTQTELHSRSMSQLGQDLWVVEQLGYKRGGYFVEFGATDGVLLNNTHLLEAEFGWQGLCAEPNPKLFERLARNRRCGVSDACIAGESGRQVEFIFADVYGGISDYAGLDDHASKRETYRTAGAVGTLTTISLHDFLVQHGAPTHIDYLSIDTEGSEFEILNAFPFERWRIELITVEHNFTDKRVAIRALLESKGYRCEGQRWDDWYRLEPA